MAKVKYRGSRHCGPVNHSGGCDDDHRMLMVDRLFYQINTWVEPHNDKNQKLKVSSKLDKVFKFDKTK